MPFQQTHSANDSKCPHSASPEPHSDGAGGESQAACHKRKIPHLTEHMAFTTFTPASTQPPPVPLDSNTPSTPTAALPPLPLNSFSYAAAAASSPSSVSSHVFLPDLEVTPTPPGGFPIPQIGCSVWKNVNHIVRASWTIKPGPKVWAQVWKARYNDDHQPTLTKIQTLVEKIARPGVATTLCMYLCTLENFTLPCTTEANNAIAEVVKAMLLCDHEGISFIEEWLENPGTSAVERAIKSTYTSSFIIALSLTKKKTLWNVYCCNPPDLSLPDFFAWACKVRSMEFIMEDYGRGTACIGDKQLIYFSCKSLDHLTGLCPFTSLSGWFGPASQVSSQWLVNNTICSPSQPFLMHYIVKLSTAHVVHHNSPHYRVFRRDNHEVHCTMALIHAGVHDCAAHMSKNCMFRGTARGYEHMFALEVQRMVHLIAKCIFPGVQIQEMEMVDSVVLWLPTCPTATCRDTVRQVEDTCSLTSSMPSKAEHHLLNNGYCPRWSLSPVIAMHHCSLLVPMSYYSLHGSRVALCDILFVWDQAKEREEDSDSDSDLDFDSNNVTTEKDSSGMSDDDMLGNPFQSMAVEISGMPELGGEHNQAGAVKGEGKQFRLVQVHAPIANVPHRLPLLHHNTVELKVLLVKGKMKVPILDPLAFSWPLEHLFCYALSVGSSNTPWTLCFFPNDGMPGRVTLMLGGYMSYKTSRTASRARFEPIFGRNLGRSSVVIALEKALPDLKITALRVVPDQKSVRDLGRSFASMRPQRSATDHWSEGNQYMGSQAWAMLHSEDFRIDFQCLPCSGQNKSAALVFAAECMKGWQGRQGENHTLEDVLKAWLTHIMALRMWYKHKQLDELDENECKARNRQRQRKNEQPCKWISREITLLATLGAWVLLWWYPRQQAEFWDSCPMRPIVKNHSCRLLFMSLTMKCSSVATASGMECSIQEQMCCKSTWDMGRISSKSWWVALRVKGLISCGRHKEEE
ncbi:hypothetical protein EDC04DRAFT_2605605 [Pisolithus marmoratus]|nr:hypothetical protein EDC04DRAFT_2605605 [Pisolithus marmoratus]